MTFLKRLARKFEDEMAAAGIAQAGDTELASQMIKESLAKESQEHPSRQNQEMMHLSAEPAEGK